MPKRYMGGVAMATGCHQRSTMAALLTMSISSGSVTMCCAQLLLTSLLQTAATHATNKTSHDPISVFRGDTSLDRRVPQPAEVSQEHVTTLTSTWTARAVPESTETPQDGQSGDRDGHIQDKDRRLHDINRQISDREGQSRYMYGHNNDRKKTRRDRDQESTNRDELRRDSNEQSSSRDEIIRDSDEHNSNIDELRRVRDEQSSIRDEQKRDSGEQSSNTDEESSNRRDIDVHKLVTIINTESLVDCAEKMKQNNYTENYGVLRVNFGRDVISNLSKRMLVFDYRSDNLTATLNRQQCRIHTRGVGRVMLVKMIAFDITSIETVMVFFATALPSYMTYFGFELPQMFLSDGDHFGITIMWYGTTRAFRLELQYEFENIDNRLNTTLHMTSHSKGTLRSPFWDGLSVYAFNQQLDLVSIDVRPYYDGIIFSWEHLGFDMSHDGCTVGEVKICADYQGGNDCDDFYDFCGQTTPLPLVIECDFVEIDYSPLTNFLENVISTGFSLRFSLHKDSALAQQLPGGAWDCSVPYYWDAFKEHLLCNLFTDCVGGEDEAACPYSNVGTCPHGYWSAGGSCFYYDRIPKHFSMSWNDAVASCKRRGDRLPTLNTEDKWRAVVDLLTYRRWRNIFIGLTSVRSSLPPIYNKFLQWSDLSVAYYVKAKMLIPCESCAFFRVHRIPGMLYMDFCHTKVTMNLLCEKIPSPSSGNVRIPEGKTLTRINSTRCPKGHVTHNFLSCDPSSDCFSECYESLSQPLTSLPPSFQCHNKFQRVPFTLVCDHRADCSDASDEICVFPQCKGFECDNKQCIPLNKKCDGLRNCVDGSDEFTCITIDNSLTYINMSKPLPAMVLHDGKGFYELVENVRYTNPSQTAETRFECPDSHFQCPGVSYYCLPVYVRCNGVYDCPGHQDEADCDSFHCPRLYSCRGSKVCLHSEHLCDGVFQCPKRDDELMCGFVCPAGCTCYGLAFFCTLRFDASGHAGLTFLNARGSGMSVKALVNNTMLFYLNLAKCNITNLETMHFVNVYHLDLSENSITTLEEHHIRSCRNLQHFILAWNPIRNMFEDPSLESPALAMLDYVDLSSVPINSTGFETFRIFRHVSNLNLSNTGIDAVAAFAVFGRLRVLDLRGCPVTYFTRSIFQGLEGLSTVYADNYKLCCPDTLPDGFNVLNCHAPFDEVSSCEGLLKSVLYRVSLSVLTAMIIVGNVGSFVYRVIISRSKKQTSFGLFVTNLCVSDFLMGVYSAVIGVADRLYFGDYVWNDVAWRRSITCKMAGFLSLVSNEVSVLIICLITVDRFLVIRFPFSRQFHFSLPSARVACVTAWSFGVLLAVTPLLPLTSHWNFYSQTGICIPLPVTRVWFDGRAYSFGVLVVLNFVLFLVIATGQISIYLAVSANSMTTSNTTQKAKDLTIARRLITVAVSDFLCWFPVGLLGILSAKGHPIPGEASVVIAVFVLPLNSALNPFLYTVNILLEQRQRVREQRLLKMLLARHGYDLFDVSAALSEVTNILTSEHITSVSPLLESEG